ncbi:MAG: translation initiation factor IF-3 [Oscillospiraceae bacterium]|nr:translation initiation factor IF-3 [Oscillospiraceae bacterium]
MCILCGCQSARIFYGVRPAIYAWRCFDIANLAHQINEEILDKEIRLISDTGEQLGLMSVQAAMEIAMQKDMDLVKIAPGSVPPVCKIMDYGKFRFEQAKKDKEAKKNQHIVEVKEIRMSPGIGENDFNVKLKSTQKFIQDGDRVKVSVRFKGRQMAHTELGAVLLKEFAEKCSEYAVLDKEPKLEGRSMSIFISPKQSSANK